MGKSYPIGNQVRITVQFLTVANVPIDPSSVAFLTKNPDGTIASQTYLINNAAIVRDGTGVYHIDLIPGVAGEWQYEWRGTGVCIATIGDSFVVQPSNVQ